MATKELKADFSENLFRYFKNNLNVLREFNYSKVINGISHRVIVPYASYSPWLDDNVFLETYEKISKNTLVDIYRCYELYSFLLKNKHIKGNILEVGVWKGGTAALMIKAINQVDLEVKIHLVDTFEGVVKASDKDTLYKGGEHSDTSPEEVRQLFEDLGLKNYQIFKGIYPEQVSIDEKEEIYRLCHIDVDTYESARDIFYSVWPKISKGGCVIFDDYGFYGCEGVTELVNNLDIKDAVILYNLNGHALLIKVSI